MLRVFCEFQSFDQQRRAYTPSPGVGECRGGSCAGRKRNKRAIVHECVCRSRHRSDRKIRRSSYCKVFEASALQARTTKGQQGPIRYDVTTLPAKKVLETTWRGRVMVQQAYRHTRQPKEKMKPSRTHVDGDSARITLESDAGPRVYSVNGKRGAHRTVYCVR